MCSCPPQLGQRLRLAADYKADRQRLFRDSQWIENQVIRSVRETISELMRLVEAGDEVIA